MKLESGMEITELKPGLIFVSKAKHFFDDSEYISLYILITKVTKDYVEVFEGRGPIDGENLRYKRSDLEVRIVDNHLKYTGTLPSKL